VDGFQHFEIILLLNFETRLQTLHGVKIQKTVMTASLSRLGNVKRKIVFFDYARLYLTRVLTTYFLPQDSNNILSVELSLCISAYLYLA